MRAPPNRKSDERGFTLVELLTAVVILGIVGAAVTQAIIVALRTTDGSVARVSGSIASEALTSYFSADASSAETVNVPAGPACAPAGTPGVFLRLSWNDNDPANPGLRMTEYGLDPATGGEQDLVRWHCNASPTPNRRVLGHFVHDPDGPPPVVARCDDAVCPAAASSPQEVSLLVRIEDEPASEVAVRRRAA